MENNNNVLESRGLNSYFFTEKGREIKGLRGR